MDPPQKTTKHKYQCMYCDVFPFAKRQSLEHHLSRRKEDKDGVFHCPSRGNTNELANRTCPMCDREFSYPQALRRHLANEVNPCHHVLPSFPISNQSTGLDNVVQIIEEVSRAPYTSNDGPSTSQSSIPSLPHGLQLQGLGDGRRMGVFTGFQGIPSGLKLGPLLCGWTQELLKKKRDPDYPILYKVDYDGNVWMMDRKNDRRSNQNFWMKWVRLAFDSDKLNATVEQQEGAFYFRTCEDIPPSTELRVGYGKHYANMYAFTYIPPKSSIVTPLFVGNIEPTRACPECGKIFPDSELKEHIDGHSISTVQVNDQNNGPYDMKKYFWICLNCDYESDSETLVHDHYLECYPNYSIPFEEATFKNSKGSHSNAGCPICEQRCTTKAGWMRHIKKSHVELLKKVILTEDVDDPRLQCTNCHKQFRFPTTLYKHFEVCDKVEGVRRPTRRTTRVKRLIEDN